MLLLFPVSDGQLIKNRVFAELIKCGKTRFQTPNFSPDKKNVLLLFNEQSPIEILKTKKVNNIRFPSLTAPTTDW